MKKIICLTVLIAMLAALAACGKQETSPDAATATTQQETTVAAQTTADVTDAATTAAPSSATAETADAMIPGTLCQLNLEEGKEPLIKGVALDGNRVGSSDEKGINGRAPSDKDIRFIFEQNEWLYIRPDTKADAAIAAYLVPHQTDEASYADSISALLTDAVPYTELKAPEEADGSWGEFYQHPEEWQPGDYDLVFTSGMKPVARVLLKTYPEGSFNDQTDVQLTQTMQELTAAAQTAATAAQ